MSLLNITIETGKDLPSLSPASRSVYPKDHPPTLPRQSTELPEVHEMAPRRYWLQPWNQKTLPSYNFSASCARDGTSWLAAFVHVSADP